MGCIDLEIDLERLREDTPPLRGMIWPIPCRDSLCAAPPPRGEPLGCTLLSASSRITRAGTPSSGCSSSDLTEPEIQRRSGVGECWAIGLRRGHNPRSQRWFAVSFG